MTRLVLVGNDYPNPPNCKGYCDFIDGSDLIVRCNRMHNYEPHTHGMCTDILLITARGEKAERIARGTHPLHAEIVKTSRQVWFLGDHKVDQIIRKYEIPTWKVTRVPERFGNVYERTVAKLAVYHPGYQMKDENRVYPSTGACALYLFANYEPFNEMQRYVVHFDYVHIQKKEAKRKGRKFHNWDAEARYLQDQIGARSWTRFAI